MDSALQTQHNRLSASTTPRQGSIVVALTISSQI
jgi:hypothetical protein